MKAIRSGSVCASTFAILAITIFSGLGCSGECEPSPGAPLEAGVAVARLDVPIGVSMGGYGLRAGPRTQYSELLGGSDGYYDWPGVKVLSLKVGDERLVIAKGSICMAFESMRTQIVSQVLDRTGIDLDRSLVLNGTHTHSGPARFMPGPDILGLLSMDAYHQEIADRVAGSFTGAIVEALASAVPARIGFGWREPFDPEEVLVMDRRCHNGPGSFKEDRLLVGHVETEDGETMAVLVSMAVHGTHFNETSMTGDVPDGIERWIEASYDRPVTAIFLQGAAGDVNPCDTSPFGHTKRQMVDWIGFHVSLAVAEIVETIETDGTPALEVATRRIAFDRETLGYQPGEFGQVLGGKFREYEIGAFQCGVIKHPLQGSVADCDDPETSLVDGYLGCLINLSWPVFEPYVPYYRQVSLTAARIGDQVFFTMPGEITGHLALGTRESIARALAVDIERVNTIGYANSYLFYLTQDWDWMQGGYETEMSLFGPRFGPFLLAEATALAKRLDAPGQDPADSVPPVVYIRDSTPVEPERSEGLGDVVEQPAAVLHRFDTVRFAWLGGHPGVDAFRVRLQHMERDGFADVLRPNGQAYDDAGWETKITHLPNPAYGGAPEMESRAFVYLLEWETSFDDPAGELRFHVEGKAVTEAGLVDYELVSNPFEIAPFGNIRLSGLSAEAGEGMIEIRVDAAYPRDSLGRRMRSPLGGGARPGPVVHGSAEAMVVSTGHEPAFCELVFDTHLGGFFGRTPILEAGARHRITIIPGGFDDGWGNTDDSGDGPVTLLP